MGNISACVTGPQLYVCPNIVLCCTKNNKIDKYIKTIDFDACQASSIPLVIKNGTDFKENCYVETGELVCDTPVPSSANCCESESHSCPPGCPPKIPTENHYPLLRSTETNPQSATSSPASPSTSSRAMQSSGTTTSTTDPLRAPNPAARTSVSSSGQLATPTSPQVLQNNRAAPKSNTAAVAGGIAGGIIGLALLLTVLAICSRRRTTRTLRGTDQGKLPVWGSGQARTIGAGGGELEEIKQGPSPSICNLFLRLCVKLTTSL